MKIGSAFGDAHGAVDAHSASAHSPSQYLGDMSVGMCALSVRWDGRDALFRKLV